MNTRTQKPIHILFALAVCGLCIADAAAAQTIVLQPSNSASSDTFIYQYLPTFNFNGLPFGDYLSAANSHDGYSGDHNTDTLIRFDLASSATALPAGAQVAAATLQLYAVSAENVGFGADPTGGTATIPYHVQALSNSFTAGTATYNDLAQLTQGSPLPSGVVGQQSGINQWVSLNVIDQVNAWLNGSLANNGLVITADNIDIDGQPAAGVFYSALGALDAGSPLLAPRLLLTTSGPAFTWSSTSGNAWNAAGNWTNSDGLAGPPGLAPRPGNTDAVAFSGSGAATSIDVSGVNPSIAALNFSGSNYTLSGGSLTLKSASGTAAVAVGGGSQAIGSRLVLADDLLVSLADQSQLNISGIINGNGTLSVTGSGTLILSGSENAFMGGIDIASGSVVLTNAGAAPDGASLTVGPAADFASAPIAAAAAPPASLVEPVPEPATLSLGCLGMILLFARRCGVKCRCRHAPSSFAALSKRFTWSWGGRRPANINERL